MNKFYIAEFKYKDLEFNGVVHSKGTSKSGVECKVQYVIQSNNPSWRRGWLFWINPDAIKKCVTPISHPEYFL